MKTIFDLPVAIHECSEINEPYRDELLQVANPKELYEFTHRWSAVWQLPWNKRWELRPAERYLSTNTYNARETLECMKRNRIGPCSHLDEGRDCISVYILVPPLLMQVLSISREFGCPDGVALIQMQIALNNLDPALIWG